MRIGPASWIMYSPCLALALASILSCYVCQLKLAADVVKYGKPLDGFISYSLEFSSFPDYAGKNDPVAMAVHHMLTRDFRQQ